MNYKSWFFQSNLTTCSTLYILHKSFLDIFKSTASCYFFYIIKHYLLCPSSLLNISIQFSWRRKLIQNREYLPERRPRDSLWDAVLRGQMFCGNLLKTTHNLRTLDKVDFQICIHCPLLTIKLCVCVGVGYNIHVAWHDEWRYIRKGWYRIKQG